MEPTFTYTHTLDFILDERANRYEEECSDYPKSWDTEPFYTLYCSVNGKYQYKGEDGTFDFTLYLCTSLPSSPGKGYVDTPEAKTTPLADLSYSCSEECSFQDAAFHITRSICGEASGFVEDTHLVDFLQWAHGESHRPYPGFCEVLATLERAPHLQKELNPNASYWKKKPIGRIITKSMSSAYLHTGKNAAFRQDPRYPVFTRRVGVYVKRWMDRYMAETIEQLTAVLPSERDMCVL